MKGNEEGRISRQEFFLALGRYSALGALGLLAGRMISTENGPRPLCGRTGACGSCPVAGTCEVKERGRGLRGEPGPSDSPPSGTSDRMGRKGGDHG